MTIREIREYKIYTRLNNSHERTVRIQHSQHKNNIRLDGTTQSQEAFIGIHSHRQPKYAQDFFYKNKPCQPSIFGIYKKLKWIKIEPNKKECFRRTEWNGKDVVSTNINCRFNGICGTGHCLAMKKILTVCKKCYKGLLIKKFI